MNSHKTSLGIDLGTSNSAAAVAVPHKSGEGVEIEILTPDSGVILGGRKAYPSVVAFLPEGGVLVGEPAARQRVSNSANTFTEFKRLMGKGPQASLNGQDPVNLARILLAKIKGDAERTHETKFLEAVITVPAYFNNTQREATKKAAEMAGFQDVSIMNEPTAAAVAYGFSKTTETKKVLVFDLGGGTLDITIMDIDAEHDVYDVLVTHGNNSLGGMDIDKTLVNFFVSQIQQQHRINVLDNPKVMASLKVKTELLKMELSSSPVSNLDLEFSHNQQFYSFTYDMERSEFESLINPFVEDCLSVLRESLKVGGISAEDVESILLVGGPTKIPYLRSRIENVVGNKISQGVDPLNAVCVGAALKASSKYGILSQTGQIIESDVTPFTLGIGVEDGIFSKIISRNSKIPTQMEQIYTNSSENQTFCTIPIYQGERGFVKDNFFLGTFDIKTSPGPRGSARIKVTFKIDADGIISVEALDEKVGEAQSITIQKPTSFSKEEIQRKVEESEREIQNDNFNLEMLNLKQKLRSLTQSLTSISEGDALYTEATQLISEMKIQEVSFPSPGTPHNQLILDSNTQKVTSFEQRVRELLGKFESQRNSQSEQQSSSQSEGVQEEGSEEIQEAEEVQEES